jgi:hypothetical protein
MAYDFTGVVNQMRSAGVAQAEIDDFLREQERLERDFQSQFDTTRNTATDQFKTAQAEIDAMFAKEKQSLDAQRAAFEQTQTQAQEQARALAAQVERQQEELARQRAESQAQFEANAERIMGETEGVQREAAERVAGRRRSRRGVASRDNIINALMAGGTAAPKLGGESAMGMASPLGADQTLGVG